MEIGVQIKKYRTNIMLSQEELANKIFVTRQTISNWENNKSYPDIHSLLLLSSLFNVSLDQLVKGDIDIMRKEIGKEEHKKFNHVANVFTVLCIVDIVSFIPLAVFMKGLGLIIWTVISIITFIYSIKVEKMKKQNNIHTFKEIVAFTEGKRLDELESIKEHAKRPYQNVLKVLLGVLVGIILALAALLLATALKVI